MAENVLLYSPQVKIDAPNEIICTVETAIPVTTTQYTRRMYSSGTISVAKYSQKTVAVNPMTIRFKKSGRFIIKLLEYTNDDTLLAIRWLQVYKNGDTTAPFFNVTGSLAGLNKYICSNGTYSQKYADFEEGDELQFKYLACTSTAGSTTDNTVCFGNTDGKYAYSSYYNIDFLLGRSVAKITNGILTVENEVVTDIYDYIEIVE